MSILTVAFWIYMLLLFTNFSDQVRTSYDINTATQMNEIIQTIEQQPYTDIHYLKSEIQSVMGRDFDFTTQSNNSGFFYLANEHRIIHLKYEDAYNYLSVFNPEITGFKSPDQLFGDGLFLLTLDNHPVSNVVAYIYSRTLPNAYLQNYAKDAYRHLEQETTLIERLNKRNELSSLLSHRLEQVIDYYHPSKTLYVNNQSWRTTAPLGQDIKNIVFFPGIYQIPKFPNRGYTVYSINFPIMTLPSSVKYIESGAFGLQFAISYLQFTGELSEIPSEDAFGGVFKIQGLDDLFYRDNLSFQINDLINGMPLVTYEIDYRDHTTVFDFSNMHLYFQSRSMIVMDYIVYFDARLPSSSKIYVYTEEGYFGYIIPIRR
jgi:hypothetical protein